MPNIYIRQQCQNMIHTIQIFEQACVSAAKRDDGKISKDEEAAINRIRKASEKHIKSLAKIANEG